MTNNRVRSYGIHIGILPAGKFNAVTDVPGVKVGQVTLEDDACGMHTGVTAILPHGDNVFQEKVPAGVFVGNGFGKSAGIPQINELGTLETPIVLTNTLNVASGIEGLLSWTLEQPGNEAVKSVNAFVGETNDGRVNDIRARFVSPNHVIEALRRAESGPVEEGCCGAGTGTVAFGFKAGIGTASRKLPESLGGWTVGVIVQANFGGFLTVKGVEVGRQLGGWSNEKLLTQAMPAGWAERVKDAAGSADGSIMMIAATDAPLTQRSLERLAERAFMGMTRTGIRARFVSPNHVIEALRRAESGPVEEGCCGAGTGTVAFGFKAGIGTASRKLPESLGGWTVGVIVQANFGGFLTVKGVEVGRQLGGWSNEKLLTQAMPAGWAERVKDAAGSADGSIMMIAATDAPLTQRSLERLAERAFMGMTRTGGIASNGSGDFALAFSTAPSMRVRHEAPYGLLEGGPTVRSDDMTPLFMAAIESTEEAILNALFTAHDTAAYDGGRIAALPREAVLQMLRKAGVLAER